MSDPIKDLLADIASKLDDMAAKQAEESQAMKVMYQRIINALEMAKRKALVLGERPPMAHVPHENLLMGFIAANEQRAVLTEACRTLCTLVGSVVMHVEPTGEATTLAGDSIQLPLPTFGEKQRKRVVADGKAICNCFHAPEQHGPDGCAAVGMKGPCDCAWNGDPDCDTPTPAEVEQWDKEGKDPSCIPPTHCSKCGGEKDANGWCAKHCTDDPDECPNPRCNLDKGHDQPCGV